MRRGIFGGSFNPIHNGHVRMALSAMESLSLDFISVIPLGNPPHKTNYELLEGFHRFQMCKFAFEGYNNIEISSMEIDSPKQSFTINTIHQLRAIYPEDELYLIMGTDMFLSLPQWYHYQELLKLVKICVAAREHQQEEKIIQFRDQLQSQGAEVYIIPQEALPISATEIRGQLSHGKEPDLLSPKVLEYIFQNKLYCTNK